MKIELLYFAGCPGYEALMPRLTQLAARAGVDADIELRAVETAEAAEAARFLGSPTVRVDGEDVDPAAAQRRDFGLKCRLYETPEGRRGVPSDALILAALRRRAG